MAKAKKKLENFDPFAQKVVVDVVSSPMAFASVEQLLNDKRDLIQALTRVLEINRVRATMGFKPWVCNACNQPHAPNPEGGAQCPPRLRGGKYQGECPHHNAVYLLRSFGVELDPRMG